MNYPSDFETPAFPAGKKLALSRVFSVGILAAFLILVFLCIMLIWTARSQSLSPIIVAPDWTIVGRTSDENIASRDMMMQEAVVLNFAKAWFEVSASDDNNEANWCRVLRDECDAGSAKPCTVFCNASDDLYDIFVRDVLPDHRTRVTNNKTMHLIESSTVLTKEMGTNASGGAWVLRARIAGGGGSPFEMLAFVKIAKSAKYYPATLGYHVVNFNSYRMQ